MAMVSTYLTPASQLSGPKSSQFPCLRLSSASLSTTQTFFQSVNSHTRLSSSSNRTSRSIVAMAGSGKVHVLPREMFGLTTFGIAMVLLKWLPIRVVDRLILFMANLTLGNTEKLGLRRPKTGPLELKNATGKTPVLDTGALSLIKSGNIKVVEQGVREITRNGAKFMDGQQFAFDSIVLATGYKSNVPFWLKGSDFFNDDGMPKTPFPNGWKGENGLYTVGFTRRGLLGTTL